MQQNRIKLTFCNDTTNVTSTCVAQVSFNHIELVNDRSSYSGMDNNAGHTREEKEKQEKMQNPQQLQTQHRIITFSFGMKEIDIKIMLFLSSKDGVSFCRTNKYFNRLLNENFRLFDDFIFKSIKNSVNTIPTRTNNIKNKIKNKEKDKNDGSHIFVSRCIKNQMFKKFLYILTKNTLIKDNDSSTICEFMNIFESRCKHFFDCRAIAKKHRNGQMFWRKVCLDDCLTPQEHYERSQEWALINPKHMTLSSRKYIHNLITHMSDIINNLSKLDEKLFKNETEHWRASKKINKYHDELFDVLLFLAGKLAKRQNLCK